MSTTIPFKRTRGQDFNRARHLQAVAEIHSGLAEQLQQVSKSLVNIAGFEALGIVFNSNGCVDANWAENLDITYDHRFENELPKYRLVFESRMCPVLQPNFGPEQPTVFLQVESFPSSIIHFYAQYDDNAKGILTAYLRNYLEEHGKGVWSYFVYVAQIVDWLMLNCQIEIVEHDGLRIVIDAAQPRIGGRTRVTIDLNVGVTDTKLFTEKED